MIPILYEKNEEDFTSNGLGRLRDCISCTVTEERNGIYECDFEYPINGINYELIKVGRIIGVTHNDLDDVQPFDIVSYSKPLNGIVSFHCTHISYRQSFITYLNSKTRQLDSLTKIFTDFNQSYEVVPTNPFHYSSDKTNTGYLACNDGVPRSVRQMLGGIEGSVLDTYGGEYEWNRWKVILHSSRGVQRPFAIRYGVNMVSYNDELDASEAYKRVIPYWINEDERVVGIVPISAGGSTPADHNETVALDLSDRFETKPTVAQLDAEAQAYVDATNPYLPTQTIKVSFERLQDLAGYEDFANLEQCELCDTIKVIFPDYNTNGYFKIVKTVWDALSDKYTEMELGSLQTTLSEALGISVSPEKGSGGGAEPTFDSLTVTNDITAGGDISADGKATFGAINGDELFAYSSVSMTSSSINANASGEVTSSASNLAGYYPIAITNVSISTGVASLRRFYFSTQQTGKAVVKIGLQNDGTSAKTISVSADILWIKVTV